ncbi:hypothetical protein KXX50_005033, partial [Aspergillus fumigatus]
RARILAFGYDARVVDWNMVSQNRIGNHSRNLLQAVADYRENDMTNDRHIIFVAHSLGGLICEDALVVSSRSVEKYLRSVFNCTFGLAFMGTPHHGSDMAQWAETMRKFTSVFKQTNPELLRALERDSEVLARIQDEFHTLLRSRSKDSPLEIFCFYEEKPLTVVGTVVPMDSAILPGYLHASLPYDHRDMTKFASVDDPGFITVTNVLRRWVRAISEVAPRPAGQILNIYQMYRGTDKISDTNTGKLLSVARCANCNALNHPTSKCKWEKGDECHKCIFSPFISIIPHLLLNNANTSKANNMGTGQQNVNIPENATSAAAMATCEAIADTQRDAISVDNMTISVQTVPGRFLKRGVPLMILYHAYGKCLQLGWVKLIAQAHIMYGRDDIAKLEAEVDRSEFVVPIGNANADIQASRFANSVIPKHDRALIVPTKVVAMDLSEEHTNGSNTKSLQKSPMDQCSTPLGRTDRSNPMMATVNALLSGTSIANIITIPGTESITSTNERRYMPVLFHRLATAMNDQQNKRIIRWSEDGNTVVIVNEQVLTTKLLPAFNIPNYFSFTQQLEKLGFRWVEQGYEHPCFTRDIPEGQFHSIRGNDRTSLPSSSTDYQLIWPSNVANLRTPSSISVTETSAGDGSVWSSPSDIQPLSARHGAPSGGVSCGINYRVAKRGRKSKAQHANRAV